jgi:hypothetical protein
LGGGSPFEGEADEVGRTQAVAPAAMAPVILNSQNRV